MQQQNRNMSIIALDIGDKRIGVARASSVAKLPEPLDHILNDQNFINNLADIINAHSADILVVGIPRNASGLETSQSRKIREFTADLTKQTGLPVTYVDESLSSVRADEFLATSKKAVSQDSIAACYILQEYLESN